MTAVVKSFAVVLSVALCLATPLGVAARPNSGVRGTHSFHSSHKNLYLPRGDNFSRLYPYFGYAYTAPDYQFGYAEQAPLQTSGNAPAPLHRMDCERSRQTYKVPSEDGGIRTIVVTRC